MFFAQIPFIHTFFDIWAADGYWGWLTKLAAPVLKWSDIFAAVTTKPVFWWI